MDQKLIRYVQLQTIPISDTFLTADICLLTNALSKETRRSSLTVEVLTRF